MSYLANYQIEQLRKCVNSNNWPLKIENWPIEASLHTNCLAFACGFAICDHIRSIFIPPENVYVVDHIKYLFDVSGLLYREISSIEEAEKDEIVVQVRENSFHNFHVIRRNIDGMWVEKKGWNNGPTEITNWRYEDTLYPIIACTFAVKKQAS